MTIRRAVALMVAGFGVALMAYFEVGRSIDRAFEG